MRFGDEKVKFWTLNFSNKRHGFSLKYTWVINLDAWVINLDAWVINLDAWVINLDAWVIKLDTWVIKLDAWVIHIILCKSKRNELAKQIN